MALAVISAVAGLVVLGFASDRFVVAAAGLARVLQVQPVLIGVVVVGIGTSLPEAVVSGLAAARGEVDLALGNLAGSNLANLSLVLGLAAVIVPLTVSSRVLRREAPFSVVACLLFAVLAWDGLSVVDGVVLLGYVTVALVVNLRGALEPPAADEAELVGEVDEFLAAEERATGMEEVDASGLVPRSRWVLRALGALVAVVIGAQLLVYGASTGARELGVSEAVIGLTLVAVGTSLPEIVTALAAARRGEDELIVGNVLGSNLFNSTAVAGVVGLVGGSAVTEPTQVHGSLLVMVAVVVLAAVFMGRRFTVVRGEGVVLLAVYAVAVPLVLI